MVRFGDREIAKKGFMQQKELQKYMMLMLII